MAIVNNCNECEYTQVCKFKDDYQNELTQLRYNIKSDSIIELIIKCKYYKPKSNQVTFRDGRAVKPEPSKPLSGYDMLVDPLKGFK